jgi:hypothetical protein
MFQAMADTMINHIRCPICGTYFEPSDVNNRFCSTACSAKYSVCGICGSYFKASKGHSSTICTDECAKEYLFEKKGEDTYTIEELEPAGTDH